MKKLVRLKVKKTNKYDKKEQEFIQSNFENHRLYRVIDLSGSVFFRENNIPRFLWPGMLLSWFKLTLVESKIDEEIELEIVDKGGLIIEKKKIDEFKLKFI